MEQTGDVKISIYNIGPDDEGITVRNIIKQLSCLGIFSNKKFSYEKKPIGWKGDIPKYSYNVEKLNKNLKSIKLQSSQSAIAKTITQIKNKSP